MSTSMNCDISFEKDLKIFAFQFSFLFENYDNNYLCKSRKSLIDTFGK